MSGQQSAVNPALDQRLAGLSPERRALVERLIREQQGPRRSVTAIPRRPPSQVAPCSFAQQRMWFVHQLAPGNPYYNETNVLPLPFSLDAAMLEGSINEIIRRHEALRTSFKSVDGQPVQVMAPELKIPLAVIDLRHYPAAERAAETTRRAARDSELPFDLSRVPLLRTMLLRLDDASYALVLTMHHIVCDGWSMTLFANELSALYNAFSSGHPSPLPELPIQYSDFAVWQREKLKGKLLKRQIEYWREQLADAPSLELSADRPRPAVSSYRGARRTFNIPESTASHLNRLAQEENATTFMILLAAFQVMLARYTGSENIIVGVPTANRGHIELEPLIGFFVNSLVMRTNLSGNPSFREALRRVRRTALGAYAHEDVPFDKIVEELHPERRTELNPFFQIIFQYFSTHRAEPSESPDNSFEVKLTTSKFDLRLDVYQTPGDLFSYFEYSTNLFERATIDRMVGHFLTLLDDIVRNPDARIFDLALVTPVERAQLIEWSSAEAHYERDDTVQTLFEAQAERSPEAIAVVDGGASVSYAQLNERANRLAHRLIDRGVGPEVAVGITSERSLDTITGLLAVVKAGGAYVPLDSAWPAERLRFMVQDFSVRFALTLGDDLNALETEDMPVLRIGAELESAAAADNPPSRASLDNMIYVMSTSGSTGKPKGVTVLQRAVLRLVRNPNYVTIGEQDTIFNFAPLAFDASTFEIWGALLNGGRLVVFPQYVPSLEDLGNSIEDSGATVVWLTASLFRQMVDEQLPKLHAVRQLLAGGDTLSVPHVRKAVAGLPQCRVINGYGPTENTTFTCTYRVDPSVPLVGSVPIGKPISGTEALVLDQHMNLVPIGVPGELYIGGEGLAREYCNRPELTTERFVPSPLRSGGRLYRSGDLVRWMPDGNIEFLSRLDHQVKIRGFRVEPGEVEAVLREHETVKDCIVIPREDTPALKRLVAYVVADANTRSDREGSGADHIAHWETVFDDTVLSSEEWASENAFNLAGWVSSYTGQPISDEEMDEQVAGTLERIRALGPSRVLEIGCGTGLLLLNLAATCEAYCGTDISVPLLESVKRQLCGPLAHVRLLKRAGDDFTGFAPRSFDTVVLNSVVQYFPSIEYLVRVLERALESVRDGGHIFVGDVRSLSFIEVFHASVECSRSDPEADASALLEAVRHNARKESEMLVDPEFFLAVADRLPRVASVRIEQKRGWRHNELTAFRYDVVLCVGPECEQPAEVERREWKGLGGLERLREYLCRSAARVITVSGIPNVRTLGASRLLTELSSRTLTKLGAILSASEPTDPGVHPEQIWSLATEAGYDAEVRCADLDGCFEAVFYSTDAGWRTVPPGNPREFSGWNCYANDPLQAGLSTELIPQLRAFLRTQLPECMVPSAFVVLRELPLNANGKVNRAELPAPDNVHDDGGRAYIAPRNEAEQLLGRLWTDLLQLEQISIHDNFFELGGHSLLGTQLLSRVRDLFQVELPLRRLFETPTVAGLAVAIADEKQHQTEAPAAIKRATPDSDVDSMSDEEVDAMLRRMLEDGELI